MSLGSVELYYELAGEGSETVAFVNGIAMTVGSWQPMRQRFVDGGFRCLLHDCRGQLRSAKPTDPPYSMALHAADLLALLDALHIERVHLVGTSYGSEIGMVFACAYPERLSTLTLIAGTSELDELLRAVAASWVASADCGPLHFFRGMLPWAYSSAYLAQNQKQLSEQEAATASLPDEYFSAFKRLVESFTRFDFTSELKRIACPTLVISAERDLIKGPEFGRMIHRNVPQSEFVVIPDAGHAVVIERPDTVSEHVLTFLQRYPLQRIPRS